RHSRERQERTAGYGPRALHGSVSTNGGIWSSCSETVWEGRVLHHQRDIGVAARSELVKNRQEVPDDLARLPGTSAHAGHDHRKGYEGSGTPIARSTEV